MARLALLMPSVMAFETYCRRKQELAQAAALSGYHTIENVTGKHLIPIGNDRTRRVFDGDFYRSTGSVSAFVAGVRFEHFLIQPRRG